jgi:hypothetical protein
LVLLEIAAAQQLTIAVKNVTQPNFHILERLLWYLYDLLVWVPCFRTAESRFIHDETPTRRKIELPCSSARRHGDEAMGYTKERSNAFAGPYSVRGRQGPRHVFARG